MGETETTNLQELQNPAASANAVGLRYVSDSMPGIRRTKSGPSFVYTYPIGDTVREEGALRRIKSLAIPAAWRDVWICPDPNGHLQATGWDARGRKQYRYHPRWREVREETKYNRMIAFGKALPKIRRRIGKDLKLRLLSRQKVVATVARLLEVSLIRVGNEEYVRENNSFGLTTMRDRHVDGAQFEAVAKRLGNTPTICRKCYIRPEVVNSYLDGSLVRMLRQRAKTRLARTTHKLAPDEAAVLAVLEHRLAAEGARQSITQGSSSLQTPFAPSFPEKNPPIKLARKTASHRILELEALVPALLGSLCR